MAAGKSRRTWGHLVKLIYKCYLDNYKGNFNLESFVGRSESAKSFAMEC